jgi:hypothetical protein
VSVEQFVKKQTTNQQPGGIGSIQAKAPFPEWNTSKEITVSKGDIGTASHS